MTSSSRPHEQSRAFVNRAQLISTGNSVPSSQREHLESRPLDGPPSLANRCDAGGRPESALAGEHRREAVSFSASVEELRTADREYDGAAVIDETGFWCRFADLLMNST